MIIMQPTFGQVQERTRVRPTPDGMLPTTATPTVKEIPYDYVATFTLVGIRGNRVQDVINISTDGAFVAVTIGYSFIPAKLPDESILPGPNEGIFAAALSSFGALNLDSMVPSLWARLSGIDFKYSIIDSGSGRELQNKAIHNVSGLGEPTGNRPFRPFARPQLFLPRSTIRIEVEEISQGITDKQQDDVGAKQLYSIYGYRDRLTKARIGCELSFVLHGYKMLGYGTG
jgi:hypothetical protein